MESNVFRQEIREYIFDLPGAIINHYGQGKVYMACSCNIHENMKIPVVIAIHGSGRNALSYRDIDFYRFQRDIALEAGFVFASISNGSDTWGLDDGLYNLNLLCDYMKDNYNAKDKFVFWSTSAGGVLMNRMVREYPEKVNCLFGTFPVYDLLTEFDVLDKCRDAWSTKNKEVFMKLIIGKNPSEFPEALINHSYYISHGIDDLAVPAKQNSMRMNDEVNSLGGKVNLELVTGGHSTSNYAVYNKDFIIDKLLFYKEA